jgi:hypothetical protein
MRRNFMIVKVFLIILAIVAIFLLLSCNSVSKSSNSYETPVFTSNLSPTGSAKPQQVEEKILSNAKPDTLNDQALVQVTAFFEKRYSKCGDYYYHKYNLQGPVLYQCKYAPIVTVEGETFQPKQLSEADRLNGVDPLPVSWSGSGRINLGLCRHQYYNPTYGPGYDSWKEWRDENDQYIRLMNKKGVWEFDNGVGNKERIVAISCEEIPDPTRITEKKEPYWGEQWGNGKILTIPASYKGWFYVGKGPIIIKPRNPYSFIMIDGTDKKFPVYSSEYGPKNQATTDPKAIAPNLDLGAVIAKVGRNGSPVHLFISAPGRTMQPFETDTDDEVYVAINDSNFEDNRGEHVIIVSTKSKR